VNSERFNLLTNRMMDEAKAEGAGLALDVPMLVGDAQRMRMMLLTIAAAKPLKNETLMQFNNRLVAIAASGIE